MKRDVTFLRALATIVLLFTAAARAQDEKPVLKAYYINSLTPPTETPASGDLHAAAQAGHAGGPSPRPARMQPVGFQLSPRWPAGISASDQGMQAPVINGLLDDPVWNNADVAGNFTQRELEEGEPATEPTEVRVLYDAHYLYIGFNCFDSEPQKIVAKEMRNDANLENDDNVRVIIDTYFDLRNGFVFETNPRGARTDAKITDEGRNVNSDWNIVWDVEARVTATGWQAEMRIPLNQLRYPRSSESTIWGINFGRVIRRKREDTYWAPIRRDYGFGRRAFFKVSKAGILEGLEFMPHRQRLEVRPYNLSGLERTQGATSSSFETGHIFDGGFDLKYGLTENLIADVTVNTDFAQVEADQERVNLTRFSLFFPEKREFFLEGAGIFRVGSSTRRGGSDRGGDQLFYSRRIGLAGGNEIPILGGTKVTGNLGSAQIGILDVLTDAFVNPDGSGNDQPRTNFGAFRLVKPVLQNSSVGMMILSKDALDHSQFNRTFAVDGNFAFGPSTTLNTWLARTQTSGESGRDWAGKINFRYRTDKWSVRWDYTDIQERFNAEMGFLRRTGIRKSAVEIGRGIRPKPRWLQRLYNAPAISYLTDAHNRLLTREIEWRTFVQFRAGHIFFGGPKYIYDVIDEDWTIYEKDDRKIIVPAGIYTYFTYDFFFRSDASKPVSFRLGGNLGEFFSGQRYGGNASFQFRPSSHVAWDFSYNVNRIQLPGGDFMTNVLSTRFVYALSRDMFAKAFIQWNDTNETLSLNFLYNFYYRAGSNIFFVYNQLWDTGATHLVATDRALLLKLSYWLNL